MNKEQLELLDDVYKGYVTYWGDPIDPINYKLYGATTITQCFHPDDRLFTKEEFINKIKTDNEFSKKWGLKIEERELNLEERIRVYSSKEGQTYEQFIVNWDTEEQWLEDLSDAEIPTKLITLYYKDKIIKGYK